MSDPVTRLNAALEGRYRIERELGEGGMATVYLAEDLRHQRKVALKVLRPELAVALGPDRFLREIQIAANLQHPHILPLHDSGEADGFLFYVMPYVEGESLRERLHREGELPIGDAVRILRHVVDALTEAHENGVVHRDIKPENVMLRGRHALVTDFGVAKAVTEATGRQKLTTIGVSLGTPAYMAPEQAAADPQLDHRVDIYACGVLGYELLAGRKPISGTTPHQILAGHVTEIPTPVSQHRPAVSAELESTIMRCLEKRPADRWQTAEDLLAHLEAAVTPSGGLTPTGLHPVAPRPRPWKAIAATAIGIIAVGAFAVWQVGSDEPAPALAQIEQLTAQPLETGLTGAAISPDGRYLAYVTPAGLFIQVLATNQVSRRELPDSIKPWDVGWYPDGTRLYFLGGTGQGTLDLYTIGLLGGEPSLTAESVLRAEVAPDGSAFAVIRADEDGQLFSEVSIVTPSGERADVLMVAEPGQAFWDLDWSPDSRRIALGMADVDGTWSIRTLPSSGGEASMLVNDGRVFQNWTGILPFEWCGDGRFLFALRDERGSNVWIVSTDVASGQPIGQPRRLRQDFGSNVRRITATDDCSRAVILRVENQADVWVAELTDGGTALDREVQVTTDLRADLPVDWLDSATLIFSSARTDPTSLWKWSAGGTSGVEPFVQRDAGVGGGAWAASIGRFVFNSGGFRSVPPTGGSGTLISETGVSDLSCALSGRCVTAREAGGEYVLSAVDLATGERTELQRIDARPPFSNFALSPDGNIAAVVHLNGNIVRLIDLQTGSETPLAVDGWSLFEFVAWAPSGDVLYLNAGFASSGDYPALIAVELDGTAHVLRRLPNVWHIRPKVSPDGRHLAFAAMPFQGNAYSLTGF